MCQIKIRIKRKISSFAEIIVEIFKGDGEKKITFRREVEIEGRGKERRNKDNI
jgi:hypothetical protein